MARIRTIKPEFPHSESMGRVSRDARLLFIELWTLCDDSGRARGSSRMLASLLFPYDDDAPKLIDTWMAELERENCIVRYEVEGDAYLQVCKWLKHQKIDKPSPSKIPAFDEASRKVAKPREHSSGDQGPRIKEGIKDQRIKEEVVVHASRAPRPTRWPADAVVTEEWITAAHERRAKRDLPGIDLHLEAETFANHFAAVGGSRGTKTDWFKTWINWALRAHANGKHSTRQHGQRSVAGDVFGKFYADARAKREAGGG